MPRNPEYPLETPQTNLVLSSISLARVSTLVMVLSKYIKNINNMQGLYKNKSWLNKAVSILMN